MLKTRSLRIGLVALSTCLMLTGAVTDLSAQASLPPLTIRYVDHILELGDLQMASALISPGAVLSTPEGEFLGPGGVTAFTAELGDSFSNIDFRVDSTHFEDDNLLIEFTLTGTQTGPYQGIPGRCAAIEVPGTALLDLDDGMVDDQWIDYDRAEIVRQADRFNQMASTEGITCVTSGVDTPIVPLIPTDGTYVNSLPVESGLTSTSDPASPCFQDANCAPAADESADQANALITSEQDDSDIGCIHGHPCLLP